MTYYNYNYIWGTHGDDTIHGTHGNDFIVGKDGNDVIYAGNGQDIIYAGKGDDTIYGGFGNDYINGGEGNDTVSWRHWNYGLYADLSTQSVYFYNGGGAECMYSIENLDGSQGNDTLKGNHLANVLNGLNGNDRIYGRGGNDTLRGQNGHDRLFGGSGNDLLNGGNGNDRSYGGSGNDRIIGGIGGNDLLDGGSGFDVADYSQLDEAIVVSVKGVVHKGNGDCDQLRSIETIIATEGKANTFDASDADAGVAIDLDLAQGLVTVENGADNPTFEIRNFVNVVGTDKNDSLRGDGANNTLTGGQGMDELYGEGGNDILEGGQGSDWLFGGLGDDRLFGGEGDDSLEGDGGNDTLVALQGDDVLNGSNETLAGAGERDNLIGGTGNDRFILGDATQAYYVANGALDFAVITDFTVGSDKVVLHGSASNYTLVSSGGDTSILKHGDRVGVLQGIAKIELSSDSFEFQ